MKMKFYKCDVCGKIIAIVSEGPGETVCCGVPMDEIIPKVEEGHLQEKHVPVILKERNKVTIYIGDLPHPMEDKHYIDWIAICTNRGNQRKCIKNQSIAKATFYLEDGEKVMTVYAYCNIHGLWKRDLEEFMKSEECGYIR